MDPGRAAGTTAITRRMDVQREEHPRLCLARGGDAIRQTGIDVGFAREAHQVAEGLSQLARQGEGGGLFRAAIGLDASIRRGLAAGDSAAVGGIEDGGHVRLPSLQALVVPAKDGRGGRYRHFQQRLGMPDRPCRG